MFSTRSPRSVAIPRPLRIEYGRALGSWLADALLAQRLGWTHSVPLFGTEVLLGTSSGRSRRAATASPTVGLEAKTDRTKSLLAAMACAALRAIDLSAELERRADRLLAVAPNSGPKRRTWSSKDSCPTTQWWRRKRSPA
jgi:hypothetical protein